jgi:hypothetical protein
MDLGVHQIGPTGKRSGILEPAFRAVLREPVGLPCRIMLRDGQASPAAACAAGTASAAFRGHCGPLPAANTNLFMQGSIGASAVPSGRADDESGVLWP